MLDNTTLQFTRRFNGLVNKGDPARRTSQDLQECINYIIDDDNLLHVREGIKEIGNADFLYGANDFASAYVVVNSDL